MLNKIHCTDLLKYYTLKILFIKNEWSYNKLNFLNAKYISFLFCFFWGGVKGALSDFCQMMLMYESTKTKYAHTPTAGKLLHYLRGLPLPWS